MQRASIAAALILGLAACAPEQRATEPAATPFSAQQTLAFDPSTGVLRDPTAEEQTALGEAFAARSPSTSDGLVQVESPVEGGGILVDLQGRFRSALTVQLDADGELVADCTVTDCATH